MSLDPQQPSPYKNAPIAWSQNSARPEPKQPSGTVMVAAKSIGAVAVGVRGAMVLAVAPDASRLFVGPAGLAGLGQFDVVDTSSTVGALADHEPLPKPEAAW